MFKLCNTMKGSYLILVLAVFLSCSRQNLELLGGRQRRETLRNPGPERKDGVSEGPEYAALSFDAEFDWPSSAAGEAVPFELVVYRGRKELRRYVGGRQNCIDANPDHHHLVSGRLFTQYSDAVSTCVAVDGRHIFTGAGEESLVGVYLDGEDIYTLCSLLPSGFTLRKNSEILLKRSTGYVCGSLSDLSYAPGGALYEDDGCLVFCYSVRSRDGVMYYCVKDGRETLLNEAPRSLEPLDLKMISGKPHYSRNYFEGRPVANGRVWSGEDAILSSGVLDGLGTYVFYEQGGPSSKKLCSFAGAFIHTEAADCVLLDNGLGTLSLLCPGRPARHFADLFIMSEAGVAVCGNEVVIALSGRRKGEAPVVYTEEDRIEVPVNGYVSCVASDLNPPS